MFTLRTTVCTLLIWSALAAGAPKEAERVRRVASTGHLWGAIQQYHPALTSNSPKWEEAFAKAAEKLWDAPSNEACIPVVDGLLSILNDPATRRVQPRGKSLVELPTTMRPFSWIEKDVLLVHFNDVASLWADPELASPVLIPELEKANTVIFDLRPPKRDRQEQGMADLSWEINAIFDAIIPLLIVEPIQLPGVRSRMSIGKPLPDFPLASIYPAGVFICQGQTVKPKGTRAKRLVFLINDESYVPTSTLALQHLGYARLITEGSSSRDWSAVTKEVNLLEGIKVEYRITELIYSDGTTGAMADEWVKPSNSIERDSPGILKALEISKKDFPFLRNSRRGNSLVPITEAVEKSAEGHYPDLGHRLLAASKYWNAINGFFAYQHLLDKPWSGVLEEQLPFFAGAKNALEYQQAVARFIANIQDSHGSLDTAFPDGSPLEIDQLLGDAALPLLVQVLEGKVAVTAIPDSALEKAGLKVGDVVLAVDGEDIVSRMARIQPFMAASTPQKMEFRVANRALSGPKDQTAVLLIHRGKAKPFEVRFNRGLSRTYWPQRRSGDVLKTLPGEVGYLDLDRIQPQDVNKAYEQLKNTQAIIFDMRGYPTAGAWMIPSRFVAQRNAKAAVFRVPIASVQAGEAGITWMEFDQRTDSANNPPYKGRVVMLMDEGAQSSAEHMGLHLEAGNNATFIGSPTSGANGNITYVFLPGNLKTYFTGLDTRHGNGDQLQRKGLQPHIFVRPTIQGLAEGRDEVLERAIQFIEEGH